MRILHILRTLNPAWGGPVEGFKNLSSEALKRGFEVEAVCMDDALSPWLCDAPISVHAVGAGRLSKFGYAPALDDWLSENVRRFDALLVHSIWMYFNVAVWRAATKCGVPYYLFIHGALDPWFRHQYPLKHLKKMVYWRLFQHKVLRDAAAVLFTTEEEKMLAHNSFRPYRCNPIVVGYGISAPRICETLPERDVLIRRLSAEHTELNNRHFLLYLGRIHEKKGIDLILRGFARLAGDIPNTALMIAGPGDQALVASLRNLAASLRIESRIIWTGPLYGEQKWNALKAADAYILPSHQENFGISVAEALACGTPVLISNKVNIWREVQRENAGLVESDDVDGTTRLLRCWRDLTDVQREQLGANARRCFLSHFDITSNSSRYIDVIRGSTRRPLRESLSA